MKSFCLIISVLVCVTLAQGSPKHHARLDLALERRAAIHAVPLRKLRQRTAERSAIAKASVNRRSIDITVLLGQLQSLCSGVTKRQDAIHQLATQLRQNRRLAKQGKGGKKGPFSDSVANQLFAWRKESETLLPIISQLAASFSQFGRGKGAANYDPDSKLQGYLQIINNSFKYTLSDINYFVYEIPTLGPVLGPVVYDVKCLVEAVVNGGHNTIDSILNGQGTNSQLSDLVTALGLSAAQLGLPVLAL